MQQTTGDAVLMPPRALESVRIPLDSVEQFERGVRHPALASMIASGWVIVTHLAVSDGSGKSLVLILQPPRSAPSPESRRGDSWVLVFVPVALVVGMLLGLLVGSRS